MERGTFGAVALADRSWQVVPQALDLKQVEALLNLSQARFQSGSFRPAHIGRGPSKALDTEIRGDQIRWVEDWQETALHPVHQLLSSLLTSLNRELFLGVRRFESQLARYGEGSFYKLHRDRHQGSPRRWVTAVLYLNRLEPHQGGEIVLHLPDGSSHRERPEPGKLLVFLSELEHEVLPLISGERWSLTTWFRDDA